MKHLFNILIIFFILVSSVTADQNISVSHIKANVPDSWPEFDTIMKRDLKKYFSIYNKNTNIEYKLLRNSPTQSGVSYPKFYAWVKIINNKIVTKEGFVRIASIKKQYVEVTHFFIKNEVKNNNLIINGVFPKPLESIIIKIANEK